MPQVEGVYISNYLFLFVFELLKCLNFKILTQAASQKFCEWNF